ncbi:MAG: NUDIX hydrolase [Bacteroidota bacterium]
MNIKVLERKRLYEGKVFNLIVDQIEYRSGNRSVREIAEHPGGAVILAAFSDRQIVLVKQYRYPIDAVIYELPAGKLHPGEVPLVCAQRELEEETGYRAKTWRKLTSIYTTPGFCSEILHIFLATGIEKDASRQKLEEGEQSLKVQLLSIGDAVAMIDRGEIVDGKTIVGILMGDRLLR